MVGVAAAAGEPQEDAAEDLEAEEEEEEEAEDETTNMNPSDRDVAD